MVSILPVYTYMLYCMYKTTKTVEKSNEYISIEKILFEYMQFISFILFFITLNTSCVYLYSIYLKNHQFDIAGDKSENHWHTKVLDIFILYIILRLF